jgi:hypothetical protein
MYKIKISTNAKKCPHNPHINTHPSQKEFALIDNQIDIVNTIICRQNKRKQNNQSKAMYQGNRGPIPDHLEGRSNGGGGKDLKKKSFLQIIEDFYFIPIEKHGQNNHFLAFTRTNIATPAIMPPNTNNTKIGNPPEEVSRPWGATVDMNANSVLPIF